MWDQLKSDSNFSSYFPDKFLRYTPPKKYFWNVYSQIKQNEYQKLLATQKSKLKVSSKQYLDTIRVTEESLAVFNDFVEDTIGLLSSLISET